MVDVGLGSVSNRVVLVVDLMCLLQSGKLEQHIYNPVTAHHEEHLLNAKVPSTGFRTSLLPSSPMTLFKDTCNTHTRAMDLHSNNS